jgi:predicted nuclease with TOPRIM domain
MFGQVITTPEAESPETILNAEQQAQLTAITATIREMHKRWETLKNELQDNLNELQRLFDTLDEGECHLEEAINELDMAKDSLSEY